MPKQLLVVDDSVTMQKIFEITFAHEDVAVTSAKNGDEAIARAREIKPDVVIADAVMSGKSGYDVCAALRADPLLAQIPCIILTGNSSPYDEVRGQKAGADGFVQKPFDTQALIDKIAELSSTKHSARPATIPIQTIVSPPAVKPTPAPQPVFQSIEIDTVEPLSAPLTSKPVPREEVVPAAAQRAPIPAAKPPTAAPIPVATPPRQNIATPPPQQVVASPQPQRQVNPTPPPQQAVAAAPPQRQAIQTPPPAIPTPPPRPQIVTPAPVAARPASQAIPQPIPQATTPAPRPTPTVSAQAPTQTAVSTPRMMPLNVPQMPRPSMIPHVATPSPTQKAGPKATILGMPTVTAAQIADAQSKAAASAAEDSSARGGQVVAAISSQAAQTVVNEISARGPEYAAIAQLSREVIEKIVWEVVPELSETIIREQLDRLVRERKS